MWTGSLMSLVMDGGPMPRVGDGATMLHWTDRTAGTVIEVTPKRIVFQEDVSVRTDTNGMSENQSYDYSRNPNGATYVFTLRQNGRWVESGAGMKSGRGIRLGIRETYYDFSF